MNIILNGQAQHFEKPVNVQELLALLAIDPATIAFERNLEIVPLSEYASTALTDGDRVEIVQFMGGG